MQKYRGSKRWRSHSEGRAICKIADLNGQLRAVLPLVQLGFRLATQGCAAVKERKLRSLLVSHKYGFDTMTSQLFTGVYFATESVNNLLANSGAS